MIMHVRPTFVLTLRVPVRIVRMTHSRVVVLVRVARAQVLETPVPVVVVVGDVKMVVSVGEGSMIVLLPLGRGVVRHSHSLCLRAGARAIAIVLPRVCDSRNH